MWNLSFQRDYNLFPIWDYYFQVDSGKGKFLAICFQIQTDRTNCCVKSLSEKLSQLQTNLLGWLRAILCKKSTHLNPVRGVVWPCPKPKDFIVALKKATGEGGVKRQQSRLLLAASHHLPELSPTTLSLCSANAMNCTNGDNGPHCQTHSPWSDKKMSDAAVGKGGFRRC